jgi:predicted nucleic acid-binding Zn ribbon protein
LRDCPACGKSGLNKLISAASFRLKGGGWYETDFKTGNKKQLAESESATSDGSNSEKSGNSEKSVGEKPDSSPSKRDGKAPADKDAVKSKGTDSKKTPSKVASS